MQTTEQRQAYNREYRRTHPLTAEEKRRRADAASERYQQLSKAGTLTVRRPRDQNASMTVEQIEQLVRESQAAQPSRDPRFALMAGHANEDADWPTAPLGVSLGAERHTRHVREEG